MKKILDACCGGRMFWFNKQNPLVTYMDNRSFEERMSNGQHFVVSPDVVADFREMPFPDNTFKLVIFDPATSTARRGIILASKKVRQAGREDMAG